MPAWRCVPKAPDTRERCHHQATPWGAGARTEASGERPTSPLIEERLGILDYNKTEGSGVTGIAVLAESHAAIHTFPEKQDPFMSVCLYSCKSYDEEAIIEYTNKYWDVKENNLVIMHRYVGSPQEISRQRITRPRLSLV